MDGPTQVAARIEQDPEIAPLFTLWGQQGSEVIRGSLLVTPIEDSVVYFMPIYLQGDQNPLPEYRRVVAVYGEQVVMRPTLDEALGVIFEGLETPPDGGGGEGEELVPTDVAELLAQADALFEQAQLALQEGNLGEYQRLVDEAAGLIEQAIDLIGVPAEA